jgi:hypothetical protein
VFPARMNPALHVKSHAPPVQSTTPFAGAVHTAQVGPQLVALSALHAPPQERYPALQASLHVRASQVATPFGVSGQALPQPPQFSALVATFTQEVPQAVSPVPQLVAQVPLEHTRPAPHVLPQAPQLVPLVEVSTSHPSAPLALQSARIASQAPTAQTPWAHVAVPCPMEQGVQLVAPQPKTGSRQDTQRSPQRLRPSAQLPSGSGASGGGTASTGVEASSPSPASASAVAARKGLSSKSTPKRVPHPATALPTTRKMATRAALPE